MNDTRRLLLALIGAGGATLAVQHTFAHGTKVGSLTIDHPYATPTPEGARTGAVWFRALVNRGREADRLVGASTPVAESVEIHRSTRDGDIARMRALDALELPPGAELKLRHGGDTHLMLVGLKAPLKDGQRFPLRLRFERAGEHEVTVWVQTPRTTDEPHRH